MLSPEERREIETELAKFPDRRSACIEAMMVVQRRRGWLSDQSLQDLAGFLGMSAEDVGAVASFYNLIFRRAVGRHVIFLCDSVSCWIMGREKLRELLSTRLGILPGETTRDGRFTLLPIVCLGACDHAPVMLIDDDLHRDVTAEGIDEILARYP